MWAESRKTTTESNGRKATHKEMRGNARRTKEPRSGWNVRIQSARVLSGRSTDCLGAAILTLHAFHTVPTKLALLLSHLILLSATATATATPNTHPEHRSPPIRSQSAPAPWVTPCPLPLSYFPLVLPLLPTDSALPPPLPPTPLIHGNGQCTQSRCGCGGGGNGNGERFSFHPRGSLCPRSSSSRTRLSAK